MREYYKEENWKHIAQENLPFLPTPFELIEIIFSFFLEKGLLKPNQILIDLGAGDGRVCLFASEKYNLRAIGVEANNGFIKLAKIEIRQHNLKRKCKIVEGDLYNYNVSKGDYIFCFQLPTNQRYFKHVIERVQHNAWVISIRWPMEELNEFWDESYMVVSESKRDFPAYIYRKK